MEEEKARVSTLKESLEGDLRKKTDLIADLQRKVLAGEKLIANLYEKISSMESDHGQSTKSPKTTPRSPKTKASIKSDARTEDAEGKETVNLDAALASLQKKLNYANDENASLRKDRQALEANLKQLRSSSSSSMPYTYELIDSFAALLREIHSITGITLDADSSDLLKLCQELRKETRDESDLEKIHTLLDILDSIFAPIFEIGGRHSPGSTFSLSRSGNGL